jgi:tRNA A37 threonylcarbamoyladenosine dehydratase
MATDPAFAGVERLYGAEATAAFGAATVAVIGLGGVGSWAAEALVRTGVGTGGGAMVLMDLDDVCVTNTNRQVQATAETVGHPKTEALATRLRAIREDLTVHAVDAFYVLNTRDRLWDRKIDVVVDAVDRAGTKALLIDDARQAGAAVVSVGGAGGRIDPARVQTADLTRAYDDTLLAATRKRLRQLYGYPRNPRNLRKRWGVPCVFSPEPMRPPRGVSNAEGPRRLDCGTGYGSSVVVTATFGLHAAAEVLKQLTQHLEEDPA